MVGMSGVGKTRIASMLRREAGWFHYSIDYRIGTRYLGEAIADEFKREAMKNPFLRNMLLSDSIYIASNITFENLSPLSTWLGKPGDQTKGGIPLLEYLRRQRCHRDAEIAALLDTPLFIEKAKSIYGYENFVCDAGGSICEVVDPDDPADPVLTTLSNACSIVVVEADAAYADALKARFAQAPKPMYYNATFLESVWAEYRDKAGVADDEVDPDDFTRSGFAKLIDWRRSRYEAIAKNWGVSVSAPELGMVRTPSEFLKLVADCRSNRDRSGA